MLLGVSLKMYFTHARTVQWTRDVADILAAHPAAPHVEAFVLPQYPSLPACLAVGGGWRVGAQDVAMEDDGPYTGEVSGAVLAELGCRYVEVGHAERRRLFGEDEDVVRAKTRAAVRNGLIPLLCVGEAVRSDPAAAADACIRQIDSALEGNAGGEIIVAYEPLWAIGAAEPAEPAEIRAVCALLRAHLRGVPNPARVIYGGSAGPGLLSQITDSVDGLFLGRFAHDPAAVRDILDEVGSLLR